jgi:serine/threonine-protein kinase RsbW
MRRVFPRTPSSLPTARDAIINFSRPWLSSAALLDFEIAVGEALANAVEHGGGGSFVVSCDCDGVQLVVNVQDRGIGFNPQRPDARPSVGAPRGYGLYLMHHLADEIEFLDGGRHLRLMKRVDLADSQRPPCADDCG